MKTCNYSGSLIAGALLAAGVAGCGTPAVPKELVDARQAYAQAKTTIAVEYAPAQLESGKQALDKAEYSFTENGDEPITRDLSYVALRTVELAVIQAEYEQASRQWSQASTDRQHLTEERLGVAENQLKDEQAKRADAEKKAAEALASLKELASVKEESRGTVITLPGSVLFASGKETLLPIARTRLAEVASVLKQNGYKSIVVEGHTDARGSDSSNQLLSLRRAEAVRSQLLSEGIVPEKIQAVGKGESTPVADNSTAEGRANNRRVELIVQPE